MTSDPVARYLATKGLTLERRQRLRTLKSGEAFNVALKIYRQLAWSCLRWTVTPSLFCLAGLMFVAEFTIPSLLRTSHGANVAAQLQEALVASLLGLFVGGPLFLIGFTYICGFTVELCSAYMLGQTVSAEAAAAKTRSRFVTLIPVVLRELFLSLGGCLVGSAILGIGALLSAKYPSNDWAGVLAVVGTLGLLAGGVWFLYIIFVHALAPSIVMLEDRKGSEAAKRSRFLLKAQVNQLSGLNHLHTSFLWLVFAASVLYGGLATISYLLQLSQHASILSGLPYAGVFFEAFSLIIPFLVLWALTPIYAICITLVYYERRIRIEGLDIEILASEAERPGASNRFDV